LKAYDRSRVPLYIQVAAVMRQRIERQQWRPGEKISTLAELEHEFEVARVTVRQSRRHPRQEGLLHCHQAAARSWRKAAEPALARARHRLGHPDRLNQGQRPERIKVDRPPASPKLHEGEGMLAPEYRFIPSLQ